MKACFPLGIILAAFLAVAFMGCGDQLGNPVAEEQSRSDLGNYRPERKPITRLSGELKEAKSLAAERNDPYLNFRFRVEIDGIVQAGFYEVILPGLALEISSFQDPKVQVTNGNLILKWGITDNMELYEWFEAAYDGKVQFKNLSVVLMDEERNDRSRWNFLQAYPVRYDGPEFYALGNDVAIETLEIAFGKMERVY